MAKLIEAIIEVWYKDSK